MINLNKDTYEKARQVRDNINCALGQINSFINILNQSINVNGKILDENNVNNVRNQLNSSLNYARNVVVPTAFKSKD